MAQTSTVNIHPGGDVILICGDENNKRLRVSSMILRHASPVFRAMLSSGFSEGSTLASSASVEIPLPDDDPDAMQIICYVLHMRNDDVPSEFAVEDLIYLAALCDKYDLCIAMRPAVNLWIGAFPNDLIDLDYRMKGQLMEIAFKFRLWKHLNQLAIVMVQRAVTLQPCSDDFPGVPFYLFDQLEKIRIQTSHKMHSVVGREIETLLSYSSRSGKCTGDCEGANTHKMHLVKELSEQYMWTWNPDDCRTLIDLRNSLKMSEIPNIGKVKKCCTDCIATSMQSAKVTVKLLKAEMQKILDGMESDVKFDSGQKNGMFLGFR